MTEPQLLQANLATVGDKVRVRECYFGCEHKWLREVLVSRIVDWKINETQMIQNS